MDDQNRTKEELADELKALKQELNSLKSAIQKDHSDRNQIELALHECEEKYRNLIETKNLVELELQKSESLYRSILNASPDTIIITDLDQRILFTSPMAFKMFGYADTSAFVNHQLLEFIDKSDYPKAQAAIMEMFQGKFTGATEYKGIKSDGSTFDIDVNGEFIRDANGKSTSLIFVTRDISDRKLAEKNIKKLNTNLELKIEERTAQLAETNKNLLMEIEERKKIEIEISKAKTEAERANMAKSEFLSRMSHELRTPMNSILGFAQLLQMGEINQEQKKWVSHIRQSGKHLLDLINEVLDISSIEAGRLSLSLEPVQLIGIIQETMDIVRQQANNRQIKLELVNTPDNQLFVKSDRQRLKQILLNIFHDAIKYNKDEGSILIKNELIQTNKPGIVHVRISISDTGLGIEQADIPKLFTPFERIGAEKTATEGTGLGLSVVKKLMTAMGGTIGVESIIGKGSTFWIEMPQCKSPLEESIEKTGKLTEIVPSSVNITGTILYIEDNPFNVELIEQFLAIQRPGIQLFSDPNGLNAVNMAIEHHPELIFLDLNLPDLHGSKVLKLLQTDKRTKATPVVIISADAMLQQINELLNAGASRFLTKPIDLIAFLKVIDEFIVN